MTRPALILFCVLFALPSPAADRPSPFSTIIAQSSLIWCHDPARRIVSERSRHDCKGEVVSEEQAKEIKKRRRNLMRDRFNKPPPVVPGRALKGTGTGFFISSDGYVMTNAHVIDGCKAVSVRPAAFGGKDSVSKVVAADFVEDLALIKSPVKPPNFARFRVSRLKFNDPVTVVGYPLHGRVAIKPIEVKGKINRSFNNDVKSSRFSMKIDIRQGNSGGPILDSKGRIAGVVVAKVNTPGMFKKTGKVIRNIGIGISLDTVFKFLDGKPVEPVRIEDRGDTPLNLFALARQFVAQIGCYK